MNDDKAGGNDGRGQGFRRAGCDDTPAVIVAEAAIQESLELGQVCYRKTVVVRSS